MSAAAPFVTLLLVLARVGSFALNCPVLLPSFVPARLKAAVVLALSGVLWLALPALPAPGPAVSWATTTAVLLEVACGAALGLTVRLAGAAVEFAGELVDLHVGTTFSQLLDPLTEAQVGPWQHTMQLFAALLFVVGGGQHLLLRALAADLGALPPGSLQWDVACAAALTGRTAAAFAHGVRLVLPLVGGLLALQLLLALLARVAPQLNIWGIGFGLTAAALTLGMGLYAPAWGAAVGRIWRDAAAALPLAWGA